MAKKTGMFQKGTGPWTQYRGPGVREVDLHLAEPKSGPERAFQGPFEFANKMAQVEEMALDALKKGYEDGIKAVLFRHGSSTSRRGRTSSRSVVRALMRSPKVTRYVIRGPCKEHDSVFFAAIRPKVGPSHG
jgi:hypothetical protein